MKATLDCPELAGLLTQERDNPMEWAEAKIEALYPHCTIQRSSHGAGHYSLLVLDAQLQPVADYDLRLPYHPFQA